MSKKVENIGTLKVGMRVTDGVYLYTIVRLGIFNGGCDATLKTPGKRQFKVSFQGNTTIQGRELKNAELPTGDHCDFIVVQELTQEETTVIKGALQQTWAGIGDDITSAIGGEDCDVVDDAIMVECTLDRFSVEQMAHYFFQAPQFPNENVLCIANEREADIATEYGDGSKWKEGDIVIHNHKTGRYRATQFAKMNAIWNKFRSLGYSEMQRVTREAIC